MKIWKYLQHENIFLDAQLPDKDAVLRFIADTCAEKNIVKNAGFLRKGLDERERTMSTGVGGGIAFPHTVSAEIDEPAVILIRMANAIEFATIDNRPVDIIIAIIAPEAERAIHVRILAGVSRLCKNPDFLEMVRNPDSPEELWKKIKELEDGMAFH